MAWTANAALTAKFPDQGQVVPTVSSTPPGRCNLWPGVVLVRVPCGTVTAGTYMYSAAVLWADRPDHSISLGQKNLHIVSHVDECRPDGWSFERLVPTYVVALGIGH